MPNSSSTIIQYCYIYTISLYKSTKKADRKPILGNLSSILLIIYLKSFLDTFWTDDAQVSNFAFTSVNFTWKKCPIHPWFLDTDFWFLIIMRTRLAPRSLGWVSKFLTSPYPFDIPKTIIELAPPLLRSHLSNSKYPLCYWSNSHVCFCGSFYAYFVQKKLIGNQK